MNALAGLAMVNRPRVRGQSEGPEWGDRDWVERTMTGVRLTQMGASNSSAEVLFPKVKIRTGGWNVRTMHQTKH